MNVELIETFLDIVETRNFNRTAERLNITQSTVSSRIRSLEKGLDCSLFERGRTGAELTAEGARFEAYARSILLNWNMAQQDLGMPKGYEGILKIAAQVSLRENILANWVKILRRDLPNMGLHVEADYSRSMTRDILFGNLDIGVLYTPQFLPDLDIQQLFDERFVMVSSVKCKLSDITLDHYIRMGYSPHFIMRHSEIYPDLQNAPMSMGIPGLACDFMVEHGGACYLPHHMADHMIEQCGFHKVPDAQDITQPVYVVHLVKNRHLPVLRLAVNHLHAIARAQK